MSGEGAGYGAQVGIGRGKGGGSGSGRGRGGGSMVGSSSDTSRDALVPGLRLGLGYR